MHAPRVRLSAIDNPCSTFVLGATRRPSWLACKAGTLAGAICLLVATGCQQTRLPNLVPSPYDADKRSFNVHDPLPETNIGPDTGARPPGFLQERSEPLRDLGTDARLGIPATGTNAPPAGPMGGPPGAPVGGPPMVAPPGAPIGPSSQFYPDAVPR
jgi:hypothetical protein